jgi:hypothetical protein
MCRSARQGLRFLRQQLPDILAKRNVMLRSRNRALAVYGLQVLLAIIAAPGDIVFAPFYRREPARDPAKAGVGSAARGAAFLTWRRPPAF